jgi:putative hemolysin
VAVFCGFFAMSGWVFLIGVGALGLAVLSALFSAIETALFSLKGFQIERLKERRPKFAAALGRLMENPRRLLSAILLGDVLVNLPLILLCLFVLRGAETPFMPYWAASLLIFALIVFVCDLVPKLVALALSRNSRTSMRATSVCPS